MTANLFLFLIFPSSNRRMSNTSDDITQRLAQLHLTHNAELSALHARHHRERSALLDTSSLSSPPLAAVVVPADTPTVATLVPASTPPASSGQPAWDIVGHKLFVGHTVILLNNGRTVQSGTVATIIRLSARKRNWVCVRVCNSKVITWRAGFNLEFLH